MTGWNKERREFLKPEYCLNTDLGGKKKLAAETLMVFQRSYYLCKHFLGLNILIKSKLSSGFGKLVGAAFNSKGT